MHPEGGLLVLTLTQVVACDVFAAIELEEGDDVLRRILISEACEACSASVWSPVVCVCVCTEHCLIGVGCSDKLTGGDVDAEVLDI